jgi:hypothetical protein
MKIKIEDLLTYETPTIAEFISIDWMRNIVARYIGWKVDRKIKRYNKRNAREYYLRNKGFIN